mmetsp:Transcript_51649/g.167758  ORF Transcript_51649/g.167758 Transcript_51649/m.167758 type:complete len:486 (+) Transcript_51649:60-1517(+)
MVLMSLHAPGAPPQTKHAEFWQRVTARTNHKAPPVRPHGHDEYLPARSWIDDHFDDYTARPARPAHGRPTPPTQALPESRELPFEEQSPELLRCVSEMLHLQHGQSFTPPPRLPPPQYAPQYADEAMGIAQASTHGGPARAPPLRLEEAMRHIAHMELDVPPSALAPPSGCQKFVSFAEAHSVDESLAASALALDGAFTPPTFKRSFAGRLPPKAPDPLDASPLSSASTSGGSFDLSSARYTPHESADSSHQSSPAKSRAKLPLRNYPLPPRSLNEVSTKKKSGDLCGMSGPGDSKPKSKYGPDGFPVQGGGSRSVDLSALEPRSPASLAALGSPPKSQQTVDQSLSPVTNRGSPKSPGSSPSPRSPQKVKHSSDAACSPMSTRSSPQPASSPPLWSGYNITGAGSMSLTSPHGSLSFSDRGAGSLRRPPSPHSKPKGSTCCGPQKNIPRDTVQSAPVAHTPTGRSPQPGSPAGQQKNPVHSARC